MHLLAERRHATLGFEQAHRDFPAFAGVADDMRGIGNRLVEEHFVEFRAAAELADRPDVDAFLLQRQQQKAQALVAARARLAARQHEDPFGFVRQRSPDFLSRHTPRTILDLPATRLHVGQIRAGIRLGITLRPELPTGDDLRQKTLLLRGAAELDQGRADQAFADVSHAAGPAGARVFLVKNHLLRDRQRATAVLFRPADAGPAAGREFAFPVFAQCRVGCFVAGAAAVFERGEAA
jgi:hypothetical protein